MKTNVETAAVALMGNKFVTLNAAFFASNNKLYCNQYVGSDVYPYEVVMVLNGGKELLIRKMNAERVAGSDTYANAYEYTSNETNQVIAVKLYKNGRYGRSSQDKCYTLATNPVKIYDYTI